MKKILSILLLVTVLLAALTIPAAASAETAVPETDAPETAAPETTAPENLYVLDLYGLLSESETASLTETARRITEQYGCGIHIGVIGDMRDYGFYDIETCAEVFFDSFGLGVGEQNTGILLLLSMAERDYDVDAHGDFAHYAFTDYGKSTISDRFLDNFRENDWYGGFADYMSQCEYLLQLARDGTPLDIGNRPVTEGERASGLILSALLSLLIAWIVCSALKGKNKTVRAAANADAYLPSGAVNFRVRNDQFSHRTVSRRHIERSDRGGGGSGGGGTTISSGGHSHSSGKF